MFEEGKEIQYEYSMEWGVECELINKADQPDLREIVKSSRYL